MKYPVSIVFLTRRCNLRCEYCRWPASADQYPDRTFEEWRPHLDWLLEHSDHISLIGGEPTTHPGFELVVRYLAEQRASFSVTSNAIATTQANLWHWRNLGLYNWSVSVDSLRPYGTVGGQVALKSYRGWASLQTAKHLNYKERHATIVVTRQNMGSVLRLARVLTDDGVWAEVTVLSWAKGPGYDVWPTCEEMAPYAVPRGEEWTAICEELAAWASKDPLCHNKEPGYFEALAEHGPSISWKCNRPAMVFDADCRLRLCREIRGRAVPALDPLTMTEGEWWAAWKSDVEQFCLGCLWDCHWQICNGSDGEVFTHGL